jgi:hypothetical protein
VSEPGLLSELRADTIFLSLPCPRVDFYCVQVMTTSIIYYGDDDIPKNNQMLCACGAETHCPIVFECYNCKLAGWKKRLEFVQNIDKRDSRTYHVWPEPHEHIRCWDALCSAPSPSPPSNYSPTSPGPPYWSPPSISSGSARHSGPDSDSDSDDSPPSAKKAKLARPHINVVGSQLVSLD